MRFPCYLRRIAVVTSYMPAAEFEDAIAGHVILTFRRSMGEADWIVAVTLYLAVDGLFCKEQSSPK